MEELLTNYGVIDMMWFDHVGGHDWGKWKFDDLFEMMYRLQPRLLVNNRSARFCGPKTPEDRGPASRDIKTMTDGDFYTPEGHIGSIDLTRDWESCIHVGKGWSYRGEDGFHGPEQCVKMLVSCTTGGGNLLLNLGPRPDGTFTDGEAAVACAMGSWQLKYGEAIYGTRGGPYRNGPWGGSCHKDNHVYVHLFDFDKGVISFDALPRKVLSARTLEGKPVAFQQTDSALTVDVASEDRDSPVTVIELTLDGSIEPGTLIGKPPTVIGDMSKYGKVLSGHETKLQLSSTSEHNHPEDHVRLFWSHPCVLGHAFHTSVEKNPWAIVDLNAVHNVKAVVIENRAGESSTEGLMVSVSRDGENWEQVWRAAELDNVWLVELTRFHAGIDVPGRSVRYLKLETNGESPRPLILQRITVYGE